jgi:molybdate transport system substrate-binding protein
MIRRPSRFAFILSFALIWLFGVAFAAAAPQSKTDITVSAAISLKDALDEIQTAFESAEPTISVHLNLGASGTLQHQIEQGAPVDVFISASPSQMDALASKGLLASGTRRDLLKNAIVLITPHDRQNIASFQDLIAPHVKVIAIGEPESVPAGNYARQVLTHFDLYDKLKPKFVFAKDVRQVLTYVETGNADAGIVYATDALTSNRVSVVATAPEGSHSPVIYPVAVLTNSKNPTEAKQLEDFLLGPKGAAVFKKYGFLPAAH